MLAIATADGSQPGPSGTAPAIPNITRTRTVTATKHLYALTLAGYLVLFLVPNAFLLDVEPTVGVDEPWYGDAALHFAETGRFSPQMFRGMHFNLEGKYRWSLYQLAQAGVFRVAGFGAYQARVVSLLAALGIQVLIFLLARRLYTRRVGAVAAVLFAFSPVYVLNRTARPETLLTFVLLLALYLFVLGLEGRSRGWSALSGFVSVLACFVHLNGVVAVLAITALSVVRFRGGILRDTRFRLYLSGVLAGVLCWLAAYGFLLIENSGEPLSFRPEFNLSTYLWFVIRKLKSYSTAFYGGRFQNLSLFSVLTLVSLGYLCRRRNRSDVTLLTIVLTLIAGYAFLFVNRYGGYLIYLFPFLAISISAAAFGLITENRENRPGALTPTRFAGIAILVLGFGLTAARWVADVARIPAYAGKHPYETYISKLRSHIPRTAVVMGEPTWYFGFAGQRYYADHYFAWITSTRNEAVRSALGRTFAEAIKNSGVEYLIIDGDLSDKILGPSAFNNLPADQVIPFLELSCTLIAVVKDEVYGSSGPKPAITKIYRVK